LEVIEGADYTVVPIRAEVALRAGRFPSDQRDPFDRVIAAQALHEDIPLLSSDVGYLPRSADLVGCGGPPSEEILDLDGPSHWTRVRLQMER
jgi:hypothetical protein